VTISGSGFGGYTCASLWKACRPSDGGKRPQCAFRVPFGVRRAQPRVVATTQASLRAASPSPSSPRPGGQRGPDQTVFVTRTAAERSRIQRRRWRPADVPLVIRLAPTGQRGLSDASAVRPTFWRRAGAATRYSSSSTTASPTVRPTRSSSTPRTRRRSRTPRDQTVLVGAMVQLDGRGSSDVDGDHLTFRWSFVSRPPGSQRL